MIRHKLTLVVGMIAILLSASTFALADCQRKIGLTITPAGDARDISGTAEIRNKGKRQRFKVSMDARVAEGTTYAVYVDGNLAGTLTIDGLGDGELEVDNDDGRALPAAVNPVCSIASVEVRDADGVIVLFGRF